MDPCERIWRGRVDDRAWRRIGPRVVELPPHREVPERGTIAEQVRTAGQVRLKNSESVAERVFDLWRGLGIRADEGNARDHTLTNHRDPVGDLRFVNTRHHRARDAPGGRENIGLARPS